MNKLIRFFQTGEDKPQITDQAEIDRKFRRHRMRIMLAITLGYGIAYTCRIGLSVVKKPLIDGGIFTAEQLGVIGSAIFYGYALGKLVNGFLADHANIKRFLVTGVIASATINICMGLSPLLWVWVALWALNGWFQGFGAPSGIVAMSHWFSNRERGRYYGIWSSAHAIGEGLTFIGSSTLVAYFGWRAGFMGPGTICIVLAVAMYFMLQDRPRTLGLPTVADWRNDHGVPVANGAKKKSTWELQISILKMPSIWILAVSSALMYATRYGMSSWGILYLQESKGYSDIQAGSMLAVYPVAGLLGATSYGFISDKLFGARRPPVNLICGVLEICALLTIFYGPANAALLTCAYLVYGFTITGLVTSIGGLFAVDIAPKKAAGAAMGFIGVFSYIGAALQERVSGYLIGQGTTVVDGVRHYDFHNAVLFWLGTSVVSLLLATSLWRAKARD